MIPRIALPHPLTGDREQRENFEYLASQLDELLQFVSWGDGAPSHTPDGRQVYVRRNGGAGTTFYVYNGAAWTAVA